MLELKHVSKTFNPGTEDAKTALDDLSLSVADGDFITILGLGHESYQEENGVKYPYSDREYVLQVVK